MKRLKKLKKHGYRVVNTMNSGQNYVFGNKGVNTIKANSITDLHKKVFGY